jgi:4-amino-4-deoxy-L-arabinose transferase-like glycosyltransferase
MVSEIVFGLSTLAVRLPAVIYGLFSIFGLYLLVKKITNNKIISLLSAFMFSISPWYFIFSRTGYEAGAGLAFFIYGIYFFLLAFENKWKLIISILLFIASAYSYNSFRILVPLFLIVGVSIFFKKIKAKGILVLLVSTAIIILSILPIYKLYSQDAGLARLKTVSGNETFIKNYLSHLSFDFLFINGDGNPRSQIPKSGQLFLLDFPFFIFGAIYIFKKRKIKYLMLYFLLAISFIPAAITKESPHALRSILAAPAFAVISAMGIFYLSEIFIKYRKYLLAGIVFGYLVFFGFYFTKFIKSYNNLTSTNWQFPYKIMFTDQKGGVFTDKYAQPYIFALFYNKIDPEEFLKTKQLNPVSDWGFSTVKSFGNFKFIKYE